MSDQHVCEQEHEFALLIGGISEITDTVQDALFDAGCDDATLSIQHGAARLEFSRSAPTLQDAILSAIQAVCNTKLGLTVLQVDECNLVTQSEIARRIKRSRQLVNQYISGVRGGGGFPPPVCHIGDTALWRWCEVSFWLGAHDLIRPDETEDAMVVAAVNNILDRIHQECRNPQLYENVSRSIGDISNCGCG